MTLSRSTRVLLLATTGFCLPTAALAAACPAPVSERTAPAPTGKSKPPVEPAARAFYDADIMRRAGRREEADTIYTRLLTTPADRRQTARRAALRLSQSALTRDDYAVARDFAARAAAKGANADIAAQASYLVKRIDYAQTVAARGAAYDAVSARRIAGEPAAELLPAYDALLAAPCPYAEDYHARIHLQIADVKAESGDVDGARASLGDAAREATSLADPARTTRIRERAAQAERDIDASLLIREGDALADADPADTVGAEARYRQVLAMTPPPSVSRLISAHFGLSNIATDRGNFAAARAELDTAKSLATPEQMPRVDQKFAQLAQREIDYTARGRIDIAQTGSRTHPTESLAMLDAVIAQQPAPSPAVIQSAQLTQADILRRERFYVKARSIVQTVTAAPQNERLTERANAVLARIEADNPKQSLHGSIVTGISYDTNAPALVNSLRTEVDDDGYPNNQRFDDTSALVRAQIDHRVRLNENGDQWRTRFTGLQTAQFKLDRINRSVLDVETGPYFNLPAARLTLGIVAIAAGEWRSGDFVQSNFGGGINLEKRLAGQMVLGAAYELTKRSDRRAGLDGTSHNGRLWLRDTVGLGQTLRGEAVILRRDVDNPALDTWRYGASLAYSYEWGDRDTVGYTVSVEPGYQFIDYRRFAGFDRHDERITADVEAGATFRRQWYAGLIYQLNDVNSNTLSGERLANHRFGIRFGYLF